MPTFRTLAAMRAAEKVVLEAATRVVPGDPDSLSFLKGSQAVLDAIRPCLGSDARPQAVREPVDGYDGLPVAGDAPAWYPTQAELDAWTKAYPTLDLPGTFSEIRAWLVSNPDRRKKPRGMTRFINLWLAKENGRP